VLVPTDKLPGWLQAFGKGNPLTFLTEAERGLLVGGPVAPAVIRTLLWSVGLFLLFAPLAVQVYRRRT
jgi:oleandomycin transport system permease protein